MWTHVFRPSALCILHSAFCTLHFPFRWCAHRPVRTVGGTPGVGFRCAPARSCTNRALWRWPERVRWSDLAARTMRECEMAGSPSNFKRVLGTPYLVLGTPYWVLGTPYAVLERQTGNRRRRVACDKTLSSRHTDHRFPPRNGPDTTNVYTTTYDVSPSLLDQPRRHRTGRFLLLGFQCSPVRHPDAKPCGDGKKCRPCSRMRCVLTRLGRRFPTQHDIVNADPRELRPAPGERQPRAPARATVGKE
jgi:hypothetical protein